MPSTHPNEFNFSTEHTSKLIELLGVFCQLCGISCFKNTKEHIDVKIGEHFLTTTNLAQFAFIKCFLYIPLIRVNRNDDSLDNIVDIVKAIFLYCKIIDINTSPYIILNSFFNQHSDTILSYNPYRINKEDSYNDKTTTSSLVKGTVLPRIFSSAANEIQSIDFVNECDLTPEFIRCLDVVADGFKKNLCFIDSDEQTQTIYIQGIKEKYEICKSNDTIECLLLAIWYIPTLYKRYEEDTTLLNMTKDIKTILNICNRIFGDTSPLIIYQQYKQQKNNMQAQPTTTTTIEQQNDRHNDTVNHQPNIDDDDDMLKLILEEIQIPEDEDIPGLFDEHQQSASNNESASASYSEPQSSSKHHTQENTKRAKIQEREQIQKKFEILKQKSTELEKAVADFEKYKEAQSKLIASAKGKIREAAQACKIELDTLLKRSGELDEREKELKMKQQEINNYRQETFELRLMALIPEDDEESDANSNKARSSLALSPR